MPRWLKRIMGVGAQLAPIAVGMFAPGLAPVVATIINAVFLAEEKLGGKKGVEKFSAVLDYLTVASPGLIRSIEQSTGKELADQDLFDAGLAEIAEGIVKMLNAFRLLPKAA